MTSTSRGAGEETGTETVTDTGVVPLVPLHTVVTSLATKAAGGNAMVITGGGTEDRGGEEEEQEGGESADEGPGLLASPMPSPCSLSSSTPSTCDSSFGNDGMEVDLDEVQEEEDEGEVAGGAGAGAGAGGAGAGMGRMSSWRRAKLAAETRRNKWCRSCSGSRWRGGCRGGSSSGPSSSSSSSAMPSHLRYILVFVSGRNFVHSINTITAVYFAEWLHVSQAVSSAFTNASLAVTYGSGVVGGACADTFAGHYRVIATACIAALISLLSLCCSSLFRLDISSKAIVAASVAGFLMLYAASGAMKPSIAAFIGDQFDETLTHSVALRSRAYSWYYFFMQLGSLPASLLLPIILDMSQPWIAFSVATLVFCTACAVFFIPSKRYTKASPQRDTYLVAGKVLWSAAKRSKCTCCCVPRNKVRSGEGACMECMDMAKLDNPEESVEDVKRALGVLTIFVTMPFFWGIFFQIHSLWVFQASDMNCDFWGWTLPYAEVNCLNNIADIILIPVFDRFVYPSIQKLGFNVTPLRKMVAGYFFTALSVCVAGVVQLFIEKSGSNTIHIAAIIPQYVLISAAEILLGVTAYDFAYSESPRVMRGLLTGIWLLTISLGNVVTALLVLIPLASSTMSFVLAGLTVVFMSMFALLAYRYNYKSLIAIASTTSAKPLSKQKQ